MTLNEIAHNILNLVRGGRPNQSEHITLDQIKFNIKHYRAMLIRRDYARNGIITRHLEQHLGCLELDIGNPSKCWNFTVTCSVSRSILKIPKTVRFNFKEAITFVGDVTGHDNIPIVDSHMIKWLPHDKYTASHRKAYMIEDHLYIYNADSLKYVNVRGIFEDPTDLKHFNCDSSLCWDDNSPFPMPMDMVQAITQGLLQGELQILAGSFSDNTTDTMQDPQTIAGGRGGGQQQGQGQ